MSRSPQAYFVDTLIFLIFLVAAGIAIVLHVLPRETDSFGYAVLKGKLHVCPIMRQEIRTSLKSNGVITEDDIYKYTQKYPQCFTSNLTGSGTRALNPGPYSLSVTEEKQSLIRELGNL